MNRLDYFQPVDHEYDIYQRYYLGGLQQVLGKENLACHPFPLRPARLLGLPGTRLSAILYLNNVAARLFKHEAPYYQRHQSHVGQYIFSLDEHQIKFAIDAHDHRNILAPQILEWCDIYFKSNKWSGIKYPNKVLPIVNGNGLLTPRLINKLKALRDVGKKLDLVFITRIWGGKEHNVQLFEQLAKLDCKKFLVAIFDQKGDKQFKERLEKVGVSCSYHTLPINTLWKYLAQSRIVVLRTGKHLCIPWRMIDLLCMGSCIVYDSDPYPEWPVPLQNGKNYVSLGIRRPQDGVPGSTEDYEKIPQIVEEVLVDRSLQERIHANNIQYFDNYASQHKVAGYIISCLEDKIR